MFRILTSFLLITNIFFSQSSNFDFSGIYQFWDIIKILESDRNPSNSDWEKLFNTPGYKILTRSEFPKQFFIDNFNLVFKPSNKNNLQKALKSGKNFNYLKHYIKVRDNKNIIDEQLKKLENHNYSKDAVKRTLEFLPQNYVDNYPPVSFVIFASNGRGSSTIIVDLAASIEWDFMSFLAHEFHHWYRNRQLQYNINKVSRNDEALVTALSKIEAEGIADMVDKRDWFTKPSNSISHYARKFLYDVSQTAYVIRKIDNLLKELYSNPNDSRNIGIRMLQSLPEQGHTTGYYMASLILENIGKKELVNCVGNPFKFIILYNEAAKLSSDRYPTFSNESIEMIKNIKQKYEL